MRNRASPAAKGKHYTCRLIRAQNNTSRDVANEGALRKCLVFCLLVERHLLVMSERLSVGLFVYCMQLCGLKMAAVEDRGDVKVEAGGVSK